MDAGIKNDVFIGNPGDCFTCLVKPSCPLMS